MMDKKLTIDCPEAPECEDSGSVETIPPGNPETPLVSPSLCGFGPESKVCRSVSMSDAGTGSCPPHGAKAVCGRRSKMEDMFVIQPDFIPAAGLGDLHPVLPRNLEKGHVRQLSVALDSTSLTDPVDSWDTDTQSVPSFPSSNESDDTLHLFAVYDGHGGVEAAKHCSERMHQNILKAWSDLESGKHESKDVDGAVTEESHSQKRIRRKTSNHVASVLHESFMATDTEFIQDDQSALVGSTAVVSLVGHRHICVGYCGDSRAVLCRDGQALPLTVDHKPERDDETERVQDAGGQVLFFNGARVMGLLAMSRAIGDRSLRPFVIPDPEVTIVSRLPEDQLLILASDGLWDVVSNQEACTLAMRCMLKAREKGACDTNAARLTATVLTRAAIDRGSRDNVTVVVVDLRPPSGDYKKTEPAPCESQESEASPCQLMNGSTSEPPTIIDDCGEQKGEIVKEQPPNHVNDFHGDVPAFDQRPGRGPVEVHQIS